MTERLGCLFWRRRALVAMGGLVLTLLLLGPTAGQDRRAGVLNARPNVEANGAVAAMRREAEAKAALERKLLGRLQALPVAVPAVPLPGEARGTVERAVVEDEEGSLTSIPVYTAAMFDFSVYGIPERPFADRVALTWRSEFRRMLLAKAEADSSDRGLVEAQRRKLELAGQGDIKRFFDWLDARRDEFDAVRGDMAAADKLLEAVAGVTKATCRTGPFGEGSLYAKVLFTIEQDGRPNSARSAPSDGGR